LRHENAVGILEDRAAIAATKERNARLFELLQRAQAELDAKKQSPS
jgi:hypothetical protein